MALLLVLQCILLVALFALYQIICLLNMAYTNLTRQNGPFKYDAYLGFTVSDMPLVHPLREKLERRDILCYPKYDPAFSTQSVQTAIREGVARSQKCLLYVSQSFIEDQWYKFEVAEVLNKVKRFSRDMLIVLKDPHLVEMPPELSGYTELAVDIGTFENPGALDCLALKLKEGRYFCTVENLRNVYAKLYVSIVLKFHTTCTKISTYWVLQPGPVICAIEKHCILLQKVVSSIITMSWRK